MGASEEAAECLASAAELLPSLPADRVAALLGCAWSELHLLRGDRESAARHLLQAQTVIVDDMLRQDAELSTEVRRLVSLVNLYS